MHQRIRSSGTRKAIPLFGLNAPIDSLGVLMVVARVGSETSVGGILMYPPSGQGNADGSINCDVEEGQNALFLATLVAEGGAVFDGVRLSDVAYFYTDGTGAIDVDVSFVPNCLPVRVR